MQPSMKLPMPLRNANPLSPAASAVLRNMIEVVAVSFMFRLSFTCTFIRLLDADAASNFPQVSMLLSEVYQPMLTSTCPGLTCAGVRWLQRRASADIKVRSICTFNLCKLMCLPAHVWLAMPRMSNFKELCSCTAFGTCHYSSDMPLPKQGRARISFSCGHATWLQESAHALAGLYELTADWCVDAGQCPSTP